MSDGAPFRPMSAPTPSTEEAMVDVRILHPEAKLSLIREALRSALHTLSPAEDKGVFFIPKLRIEAVRDAILKVLKRVGIEDAEAVFTFGSLFIQRACPGFVDDSNIPSYEGWGRTE